MNIAKAKTIPIENFLSKLGHSPAYKKKSELWYRSPLREGDKTPSFKVNLILNTWYDFGLNQGGTIIDLSCVMFNERPGEVLRRLGTLFAGNSITDYQIHFETFVPTKKASQLVLDEIQDLSHPILLKYLEKRCISLQIAQKYCKQVIFHTTSDTREQLAIAFQNDFGAYEIRNEIFKGFIGEEKTITSLNLQKGNTISIFEGFFDFLAFLTHQKITNFQNSVMILNSINMQNEANEILKNFEFQKAYFFLDRDKAGRETFENLTADLKYPYSDKSSMYNGFNDYSEFYENL